MNWLFIIVLLFLAWNIMIGYSKGFLRVVYSLAAWILMLVFVAWVTPYVSDALVRHTTIDTKIEQKIETHLQQTVEEHLQQTSDEESPKTLAELGIKLPAVILKSLGDTNELADQMLEESGIYKTLAEKLSTLAIKGIAYCIALVATMILFFWIGKMLDLISKIPIIHGMNKTLGLLAGFIKGVVLVWIAFALIAFGSTSEIGRSLITYIYEAPFLAWLYENNLVLSIILIFL